MQVKAFTVNDRNKWNDFIAKEQCFAILQSWEWGEFKEELGWKLSHVVVEDDQGHILAGAQMLIKPLLSGFASIAYIPRGPIGNWVDKEIADQFLPELHRIARLHKAVFLTIEPPLLSSEKVDQQIQQYGFRAIKYTNQPRATIIVDISPSEDEILLQMRKKTRQYIHSAVREGITVRVGSQEDLPSFYDLMHVTGQREHFPIRIWEYYEKEWQILSKENCCILLMAFYENQLLAVRTAYCFGRHAAEFHAGSISYTSNLHPNYLLVWEAIQWAKKQGCVTYDLWGIPNEIGTSFCNGNSVPIVDRTDGLWGVYRFKSGFSKNIVAYVGAYDYVYQPQLYTFISNKIVRGDTLDRIMTWMDSIKHK